MSITSVGINILGYSDKVYICQNTSPELDNNKDNVEILIKGLESRDRDGRISVVLRLADFKDFRAVQALINVLRTDKDLDLRIEAVNALAKIGDIRAVPALIEILENRKIDYRLSMAIVDALARLDDKLAIIPLVNLLREKTILQDRKKQLIKSRVADVLEEMTQDFKKEERLNILLEIVKYGSVEVRLKAINELEKITLNSDNKIKNEVLGVFKDRLGIGLFNEQDEINLQVLEAMMKAYNRIKESMKEGK